MRLLLRVFSYGDYSDCDYILINLDNIGSMLLGLRDKASPLFDSLGFYAVEWFNFAFYPISLDSVCDEDWFDEDEEIQEVPDEFEGGPSDFRAESATISVQKDGCLWHFYQKNCSTQYESAEVPWSDIESTK